MPAADARPRRGLREAVRACFCRRAEGAAPSGAADSPLPFAFHLFPTVPKGRR